MSMFERLYELVTRRPYLTVRHMAAEFGPPPAARYPQLAAYSDAELIAHGEQFLAELEAAAAKGRRPVLPLPLAYRHLTALQVGRAA